MDRLKNAMAQKYSADYIEVCIKYADDLFARGLLVIFDGNHLWKVLQMEHIDLDSYQKFEIWGKRGKYRTICSPSRNLKIRQRWILDNILYKIPVAECSEGFVKGHSIYTNAKKHIGYKQNLNIDLKDFFPSVTQDRVIQVFCDMGYSKDAARTFAIICCHEGRLPQGAPTSPYLANLVCKEMDKQLMKFAREHALVYTRYADDMAWHFRGTVSYLNCMKKLRRLSVKMDFVSIRIKPQSIRGISGK